MKKIIKWILVLLSIVILIVLYARYIGTMGFNTKEYVIKDTNIPDGYDGLKIVHFSDLHYNRAISLSKVSDIIDEINLINPDIVVFTGDLIDKDVDLKKTDFTDLTTSLRKIRAKYGKYAIIGNHDYYKDNESVLNVYNDSGFKYLENSYDIIYNKEAEPIFIGGVGTASYDLDDVDKTMEYFKEKEEDMYKIILIHEPDITDKIVKNYDVNLILAGHSHNGQVRLPFIGAIYTPPHSKKYYDNYYKIGKTKLYISSGIGVSSVNYRLWNRPSINFYRINKEVSE